MIQIRWIRLDPSAGATATHPDLYAFPAWLQQKILSHRTIQALQASYWGYRLLQQATAHWPRPVWDYLQIDSRGRPHLPGTSFDFSLSHSATTVVCALSDRGHVGVDTQAYRYPIRLRSAHQSLFSPDEWSRLQTAPTLLTDLWTRKEAVAKADGRGLAAFPHIVFTDHIACLTDTNTWWRITKLPLCTTNRTYLATSLHQAS